MKITKFFNREERKWVVVDAKDKVLGRLSTRIARVLQGKNKATYTPNFLCGDRVIVINTNHLKYTGNKRENKIYDKYSGYPSGRKEIKLKDLILKDSTRVLYSSVKGMLPKNNLGRMMLKSLRVYPESKYCQQAQKPEIINV